MGIYILSPEAEEDIFEIWRYLAEEESGDFANRVESELFDEFNLLAGEPGLGHKRQDLSLAPVLFFSGIPLPVHDPLSAKVALGNRRNSAREAERKTDSQIAKRTLVAIP